MTIKAKGAGALALLAVLLSVNLFLGAPLSEERARKEIRNFLKTRASGALTHELETAGKKPDREWSLRMEKALKDADALEFVSVEVRHFLVSPPTATRRIYVVKAVTRLGEEGPRTRYFSMGVEGRIEDYFWVNEQARWMWRLSF